MYQSERMEQAKIVNFTDLYSRGADFVSSRVCAQVNFDDSIEWNRRAEAQRFLDRINATANCSGEA